MYPKGDNQIRGKTMKESKGFFSKYHVMFFVSVIVNVYFLVTEVLNFIEGFGALSFFTMLLYFSSIVYMSLMELFETKKKDPKWAYVFTLWFLVINAALLPLTVLFANVFDSISPVYTISSFLGQGVPLIVSFLIYLAYLLFKFIKPALKSVRAKKKSDDYVRGGCFGDIVSGLFTLISSFTGIATVLFVGTFSETAMLNVNSVPFLLSAIAALVVSIICIVKCVKSIKKLKVADGFTPLP